MTESEEKRNHEILVLGAGISGLSSGISLLREGYKVIIWTKDLPPNTTSNKAAAIWRPFLSGPVDKVPRWAKLTLDFYRESMGREQGNGCINMRTVFIFDKETEEPWWKVAVEDSFRRLNRSEIPNGYIDGYEIQGLVIDTSIYMDYLVDFFKKAGGELVQKEVRDIAEPLSMFNVIVNCTGLGSRELFGDHEVYPSRGQIVKVRQNGFDYSLSDDDGPNKEAYIIPRIRDIVLGGTVQDDDWNLEPDPRDTEDILRRCAAIASAFEKVEIIEVSVGLRPIRKEVRLELQEILGRSVVHNYGHGGSGFTLCWGCAQDVVDLVNKAIAKK